MTSRASRPRDKRRGVAAVEFAFVAPLLFLIVFGTLEIGRALMTTHSLEEAARSGCRVAVLRGTTTAEVEAEIDRILGPVGISSYDLQIEPAGYQSADRWSPVSVSVTASFDETCWLPLPKFFAGKAYTSSCTLPKEYSNSN